MLNSVKQRSSTVFATEVTRMVVISDVLKASKNIYPEYCLSELAIEKIITFRYAV